MYAKPNAQPQYNQVPHTPLWWIQTGVPETTTHPNSNLPVQMAANVKATPGTTHRLGRDPSRSAQNDDPPHKQPPRPMTRSTWCMVLISRRMNTDVKTPVTPPPYQHLNDRAQGVPTQTGMQDYIRSPRAWALCKIVYPTPTAAGILNSIQRTPDYKPAERKPQTMAATETRMNPCKRKLGMTPTNDDRREDPSKGVVRAGVHSPVPTPHSGCGVLQTLARTRERQPQTHGTTRRERNPRMTPHKRKPQGGPYNPPYEPEYRAPAPHTTAAGVGYCKILNQNPLNPNHKPAEWTPANKNRITKTRTLEVCQMEPPDRGK
ncbi:hypothetical protein BS47DRAFT_1368239 [Hydnum rufescens UP504]|uniref:Uncharacterized protein n=1 Tax=Hydnum rufescens UP504 TaxID=1448309 RepID=A0A9P6AG16_9AGAM|nr:hypothetical protein BS47DRAFT_1368239 [Hydnum rufescens UP504]